MFIMIITGTTLIGLFKTVSKPVKVVSEQAESAFNERAAREAEKADAPKKKELKVIKGFDVDIPVDEPEKSHKRKRILMKCSKNLLTAITMT